MEEKIKSAIRSCPICANKKAEIIHNQKFVLPKNSPLPAEYDLVCCINCGFVYVDTPASQNDYDRYYRELSKYEDRATASGGGDEIFDRDRLLKTAGDIEQFLPDKDISILDIGCGNGGLLLALKQRGYKNLKGLDPSVVCVNNIRKQGIEAIVGGIFDNNSGGLFDLIILTHVFEHVYDLQLAVRNISAKLKPDGKLYIEVPDASRYDKFYRVPYYYFDTEHVNHFSKESLKNLLTGNNFDLVASNRKVFSFATDKLYPAIYVIGKMNDKTAGAKIVKDTAVKESIIKYLELSEKETSGCLDEFEKLKNNQEAIIVWGAGNYTMRLLANSDLGRCNIKAFIDKDSKKQGLTLKGITVYSPAILNNFNGTIVVCSAMFSREIIRELKKMKVANRLIVCN